MVPAPALAKEIPSGLVAIAFTSSIVIIFDEAGTTSAIG